MRSSYLIALTIILLGALTYWYQSTAAVCPVPISYRIGELDQAFGLSQEQALAYVKQAEAVWEDQVDRDLFTYNEKAVLSINFVYDDRQASADSEVMQRGDLDEQKQKGEEIKEALENLQAQYDQLSATYEGQVASYEARLSEYNAEVNKYNDRGGAPADIYDRLEQERTELADQVDELNRISVELKTLAKEINKLADQGNALVSNYNRGVAAYNEEFGFVREFTQGDYQGDQIHVYKFSNDGEVVRVLAHEFGHALGLDHIEGTSSLMYYLLEESAEMPTLSLSDLTVFEQVCGDSESFAQKVRRVIRERLVE